MNRTEIHRRRLEINLSLAGLAESETEVRRALLEIESQAATLNTELARLDLEEHDIESGGMIHTRKHVNGN